MDWEGSARRTRLRLQVGMAVGEGGRDDEGAEEERDRRLYVAEGEVWLDTSA